MAHKYIYIYIYINRRSLRAVKYLVRNEVGVVVCSDIPLKVVEHARQRVAGDRNDIKPNIRRD